MRPSLEVAMLGPRAVLALSCSLLAACVSAPPERPEPVVVDLGELAELAKGVKPPPALPTPEEMGKRKELRELLKGIKEPPAPPLLPTLARASKELTINRPASFSGSSEPLIVPKSQKHRVGIIGSGVPEYVVDALMFQLHAQGVELVDRSYVELYRREVEALIKGESSIKAPAREEGKKGAREFMDYVVWVHPIQDNSGSARPQVLDLPWMVPEAQWQGYLAEVERYRREYVAYAESIRRYNQAVERLAKELADEYERGLEEHKQSLERFNAGLKEFQKRHGDRIAANESRWQTYESRTLPFVYPAANPRYHLRAPSAPEPEPEAPPPARAGWDPVAQFLEELRQRGYAERRAQPGGDLVLDPRLKRERAARQAPIFTHPSQLLKPDLVQQFVGTIFRFSVSVRVVEVHSAKALWFGVVEAQNLVHLDAVQDSMRRLCERLLKS